MARHARVHMCMHLNLGPVVGEMLGEALWVCYVVGLHDFLCTFLLEPAAASMSDLCIW